MFCEATTRTRSARGQVWLKIGQQFDALRDLGSVVQAEDLHWLVEARSMTSGLHCSERKADEDKSIS